VKFELIGGVGNQLFIYFAAHYFKLQTGIETFLDVASIGAGGTNHGKTILDFELAGNFTETKTKNSFSLLRRIERKIAGRSPKFKKLFLYITKNYISPELGYDPDLVRVRIGTTVHGYFQSWKYFESSLEGVEKPLKIKNPTKWYFETLELMQSLNPTVLHIRIGDYQPLRQTFGILDGEYYRNALKEVDKDFTYPIWVFSDEIEIASKILAQAGITNVTLISPPAESSPVESLMLMSYAKRIAIGNSSYSWWAARLSERDKTVVYPWPWFRNSKIPNDMIPHGWIGLKSSWW